MRKVVVFTSTRADYGLLRKTFRSLCENESLDAKLFVSGTHLSWRFGRTIREIKKDSFPVEAKRRIWSRNSNPPSRAKDFARAVRKFSKSLARISPDIVVVLGDRLETLAFAISANVLMIPIAHIHGGEVTHGSQDDAFRHAITKLSYIHFVTTDEHRVRVIQLGEDPARVFNLGAPIVDALMDVNFCDKATLEKDFPIKFNERTLLLTLHPSELDEVPSPVLAQAVVDALERVIQSGKVSVIVTGSNIDIGSNELRKVLHGFVTRNPSCVYFVESFGQSRYLSAMKTSDLVIGNSSSVVLEAPVLGVNSLLIGNRQQGRPLSSSVMKLGADPEKIYSTVMDALYGEKSEGLVVEHPFGKPGFAGKLTSILATFEIERPLVKVFWDLGEPV